MGNYNLYPCKQCSMNKSKSTHTYAAYKVYRHSNNIKIKCKTCGFTESFKTVRGAFIND